AGGSASCLVTYTPESTGPVTEIRAQYGGDLTHGRSGDETMVTVTARATATSVSCSPADVLVGQASTCTAVVSDTDGGAVSAPTGTVGFSSSDPGSFGGSPCTLSGSGASASCSVTYTPDA